MLFKRVLILPILFLIYATTFSQKSEKYKLFEQVNYIFPYQLDKPDKTWKLPKKLIEISGLSFINKNRLACVQDEKGNIYIFDLKTGEVDKKIEFGNDGDYEGIEIIENDAWILKSNGTLFKVKNYIKHKDPHIKKYPTVLSGKNDAEGLTYDLINNSLLIACKGHPFVDERDGKEFKAIYAFDLETKQLGSEPFLLIEMDSIKFYKNYNTMARMGIELLAYFDSSKGDASFQPSGIAINPITGNIFILASVGNLMTVFSSDGKMLAMIELSTKIHPKPEGICFSPNGTLYIANEGDNSYGTILKFESK
ncbi:MAG: SdiA-regulated domain-containing protein [Bacteroidota bacterium]